MKKNKAVLYMRLSNADEKANESESISNQRSILRSYISNFNDIEIVDEKVDDGYSGTNFNRPAFQQMVLDIIDKKVDCVVVKDISRLGREYLETGEYLKRFFPKHNIRFISIDENVDTKQDENIGNKLDIMVRTVVNDAYSADISRKTKKALEIKRRSGASTNNFVVYGYAKNEEKRLIIDDIASKVVREIFDLKINGMCALGIADRLNDLGISSPLTYRKEMGLPYAKGGYTDKENCKWSANTILRILSDETYTGTLTQGTKSKVNYKVKEIQVKPKSEWIVVHNAHQPIISKNDFQLVQKLLNISTRTGSNKREVHLLSGMVICGCCGQRMTRKTTGTKEKPIYYCYCKTGRKNGCNSKMIKENMVIDVVNTMLKTYINNVVDFQELLQENSKEILSIDDAINKNILKLQTSISVNSEKLKESMKYQSLLYSSLINGDITKKRYSSLSKIYENEINNTKETISTLKQQIENCKNNFINSNDKIDMFQEFKKESDLTRKMLVNLVDYIIINEDKSLHIQFRYDDEYSDIIDTLPHKEVL